MNLYIKIENEQAIGHPISEDNLIEGYPDIDINNLPSNFAIFERIEPPEMGLYDKKQICVYECDENGRYRDVWYNIPMSDEEKIEKQNNVKEQWSINNGYASWIFNEMTCEFDSPVEYPTDGNKYIWNEETQSWIENSDAN